MSFPLSLSQGSDKWKLESFTSHTQILFSDSVESFCKKCPALPQETIETLLKEVGKNDSKLTLLLKKKTEEPKIALLTSKQITQQIPSMPNLPCLHTQLFSTFKPKAKHPKAISLLSSYLTQEAGSKGLKAITVSIPKAHSNLTHLFEKTKFEPLKENSEDEALLGLYSESGFAQPEKEKEEISRKRKTLHIKPIPLDISKKTKLEQSPQKPPSATPLSSASPKIKPLEVTLKKIYVRQIQDGIKTIEGRINSGMFRYVKEGSLLRFFYPQDERDDVVCRVTKINRYPSFAEMLKNEGFQYCVCEATSLNQAINIYDSIPGYSERAEQHGVLAFQMQKV